VIAGSNPGWYDFGRHSVSGWVVAPSVLVPSDGVFGRFDLVALCGCHTLSVCLFVALFCLFKQSGTQFVLMFAGTKNRHLTLSADRVRVR
jgi:hypothetical protein